MKGSRKNGAPAEYIEWLEMANDEWQPTYDGMTAYARQSLLAALWNEQRGLCVYCGNLLDLSKPGKSFHVEHFRPQRRYDELEVTYENLFLSCGQEDPSGLPASTCGKVKAGWFDEEKHIYPAYSNCTNRFRFLLAGDIVPVLPDDAAAKEMITRLRLDHPELKKDRETILFQIDAGEVAADDFWDAATGIAASYAHVAYQYEGREIP